MFLYALTKAEPPLIDAQTVSPAIIEAVERGMVGENVCAWVEGVEGRREGCSEDGDNRESKGERDREVSGENVSKEQGGGERHVRWKGRDS